VLIQAPISTLPSTTRSPGLKSEVALESVLQRNRFPGQRPNPGAVGSQGARQHRRARTARPAARRQTPDHTGRTAGAGGMVRLGCRARGVHRRDDPFTAERDRQRELLRREEYQRPEASILNTQRTQ
jgi:hypothetical protein